MPTLTQITQSCLSAPNQPGTYRRLAGATLDDRRGFAQLGQWLCALGSTRPALSIFRLLLQTSKMEPVAVTKTRRLALTLSRSQFRGDAAVRATTMLCSYWASQNDQNEPRRQVEVLRSCDPEAQAPDRRAEPVEPPSATLDQLGSTLEEEEIVRAWRLSRRKSWFDPSATILLDWTRCFTNRRKIGSND